jgi:hypothetical protein
MRRSTYRIVLEDSLKAQKIGQMTGFGRELPYHGIREFVNIKTVWVK